MAISKKPSSKINVSEAEINAIIEKGGSVASDSKKEMGKKNLQLRLDTELIEKIDEARGKRTVSPPRHTWILEAIYEKLQKEN